MGNPEEELATFLQMAPINLGPEPSLSTDYDFAYTPVELDVGEFVSCVRWDGAYYMIGTDVARTLAFRLSLRGVQVAELRQLKRTVFSRLRSIKEGHGMLLEPANVSLGALSSAEVSPSSAKAFSAAAVSTPHSAVPARSRQHAQVTEAILLVRSTARPALGPRTRQVPRPVSNVVVRRHKRFDDVVATVGRAK